LGGIYESIHPSNSMSATFPQHESHSRAKPKTLAMEPNKAAQAEKQEVHKNYKGFVAGVFSGISKLSGKSPPQPSSISGD
jgi:hypothetical protein